MDEFDNVVNLDDYRKPEPVLSPVGEVFSKLSNNERQLLFEVAGVAYALGRKHEEIHGNDKPFDLTDIVVSVLDCCLNTPLPNSYLATYLEENDDA